MFITTKIIGVCLTPVDKAWGLSGHAPDEISRIFTPIATIVSAGRLSDSVIKEISCNHVNHTRYDVKLFWFAEGLP